MNEQELLAYIKTKKYYCSCCVELQRKVVEHGLEEIDKYDGLVCPSIQAMQFLYSEVLSGKKMKPINMEELYEE